MLSSKQMWRRTKTTTIFLRRVVSDLSEQSIELTDDKLQRSESQTTNESDSVTLVAKTYPLDPLEPFISMYSNVPVNKIKRVRFSNKIHVVLIPTKEEMSTLYSLLYYTSDDCSRFRDEALEELQDYCRKFTFISLPLTDPTDSEVLTDIDCWKYIISVVTSLLNDKDDDGNDLMGEDDKSQTTTDTQSQSIVSSGWMQFIWGHAACVAGASGMTTSCDGRQMMSADLCRAGSASSGIEYHCSINTAKLIMYQPFPGFEKLSDIASFLLHIGLWSE